MERRDNKYQALLKACDADEREALNETLKIEKIVGERKKRVEVVERKQQKLIAELKQVQISRRNSALQDGDSRQLGTVSRYAGRLEKRVLAIAKVVSERKGELATAMEREKLAREELMAARVERKKIEKLMENRRMDKLRAKEQRSEIQLDDLVSSRHKR